MINVLLDPNYLLIIGACTRIRSTLFYLFLFFFLFFAILSSKKKKKKKKKIK
jgi:preprotein translocase subunit SecG